MSVLPSNLARSLLAAILLGGAGTTLAQPAEALPPTSQPAIATPVERANADAVARLYAKLAAESAGDAATVGQVIDAVEGKDRVMDGLRRAQQIGGPREVGDGIVQVNLELGGANAAELVLDAVNANPERCPVTAQRLAAALRPWRERTFASTGDSAADVRQTISVQKINASEAPTSAPMVWPARAPAWVDEPVTAAASSPKAGTPLRTARAAESAARNALREAIRKLPVGEQTTLLELAAVDEPIKTALDRAVEAAKIAGVDYGADGSVEVRVWIDGRQLWQLLQLSQR